MITSYKRGHKIIFIKGKWLYADDGSVADYERLCVRCQRMPTKEGYDACLGKIKGVKSACCGHGVTKKIIIKC